VAKVIYEADTDGSSLWRKETATNAAEGFQHIAVAHALLV
jgi:hypothetical protein